MGKPIPVSLKVAFMRGMVEHHARKNSQLSRYLSEIRKFQFPKFVVPYKETAPLTEYQRMFNRQLASKRLVVERTIGAQEIKWRENQLKENRIAAKSGPNYACQCVIATCVLNGVLNRGASLPPLIEFAPPPPKLMLFPGKKRKNCSKNGFWTNIPKRGSLRSLVPAF